MTGYRLVDEFERILPEGGVARKVATVASGAASGYFVAIILTPVLTRIYTPVDFGLLAAYMSFVGIITAISTLSLELAIPIVDSDGDARSLVAVALMSVLLVSVALFVLLFFARLFRTGFHIIESLKAFYWIIPIGVLGTGSHFILSVWGVRQRAYGKISKVKFIQSSGQVVLQIVLGISRMVNGPILLGDAIGRLIGSVSFLKLGGIWKDIYVKPNIWRLHIYKAWDNKSICALGIVYNLVNSIGIQASVLCFSLFYNATDFGFFAVSGKLANLPIVFVIKAISQVFMGEVSNATRAKPELFYSYFLVAIKKLNIVGFIIAGCIIVFAPLFIGKILGEQWRVVGVIMAILAPATWIQIMATPLSDGLIIIKRQDIMLFWEISRSIIVPGSIVLGGFLKWSLIRVSVAYSASLVVSYGCLIFVIFYVSRKLAG